MKHYKQWNLSKGIWGGLAAIVVFVLQWFGIDIDRATMTEILMQVGGTVGAIVAVWGRAVATEKIKWRD